MFDEKNFQSMSSNSFDVGLTNNKSYNTVTQVVRPSNNSFLRSSVVSFSPPISPNANQIRSASSIPHISPNNPNISPLSSPRQANFLDACDFSIKYKINSFDTNLDPQNSLDCFSNSDLNPEAII